MEAVIQPGKLKGKLIIPPSKSFAHRALICAALAKGRSEIYNCGRSEDINATKSCLEALGVRIEEFSDKLIIKGEREKGDVLNCGESGSTLRFMLPVALASGGEFIFQGAGRLMSRPLEEYFNIFKSQGIAYELDERRGRLKVSGRLKSGRFELSGGISSQYLTGLLLALPSLEGDSELILNSALQSSGYVDMTKDIQARFNVKWEEKNGRYHIGGGQRYTPASLACEGDYSQAAFWLAARRLGCDIILEGLNENSLQPDKAIVNLVKELPDRIDVSQFPDLVPVLAVLCALTPGRREIVNAARLRLKESDRLRAVSALIKSLGGEIEEREDGLAITGVSAFSGGVCESFNDHRIVMAAAVAAVKARGAVIIRGAQSVNKSYPEFWEHYKSLGGRLECGPDCC